MELIFVAQSNKHYIIEKVGASDPNVLRLCLDGNIWI